MSREELLEDRCKRFGRLLDERFGAINLLQGGYISYNDYCFIHNKPEWHIVSKEEDITIPYDNLVTLYRSNQ